MRAKSIWFEWSFSPPSAKALICTIWLYPTIWTTKWSRGFPATTSLKTCLRTKTVEREEEPRYSEVNPEHKVFSFFVNTTLVKGTHFLSPLCPTKIPLLQQQQTEYQLRGFLGSFFPNGTNKLIVKIKKVKNLESTVFSRFLSHQFQFVLVFMYKWVSTKHRCAVILVE